MKTLNDFKNKIQLGAKIKGTHHLTFIGRNPDNSPIYGDSCLGIREVSIKQTNSFALKTTKNMPVPSGGMTKIDGQNVFNVFEEKTFDSWCQYPKASECVFNGSNSVTILEKQRDGKMIPVLTYEFID